MTLLELKKHIANNFYLYRVNPSSMHIVNNVLTTHKDKLRAVLHYNNLKDSKQIVEALFNNESCALTYHIPLTWNVLTTTDQGYIEIRLSYG